MNFLRLLLKRLSEPSSFAGLAAVTTGVGQMAQIKEAPQVADAIVAVGGAVSQIILTPTPVGIVTGIAGLLAFFMPEIKAAVGPDPESPGK